MPTAVRQVECPSVRRQINKLFYYNGKLQYNSGIRFFDTIYELVTRGFTRERPFSVN